ncbi:MAG: SDR family NAD(P)-dependent oxidoreductase [Myxococcota bacterium]
MSIWQGRSAIVTGGGSGIGKALGAELARRGAVVWLSDVDGDAAAAAAKEVGHDARCVALDVTDADAVKRHVDDVAASHGRIDAVFNNAGIGVGGDIRELNRAHFDRCLDVNVRGVVHGILAAFPRMQEQGGGIIVNTASAAGLLPLPLMAPYCMSKHAVVGLSNSLRPEAARHGVRMNVLCPTAIETPLLETDVSQQLGATWRPDIRAYLTRVGGPPYPVERFVAYALDQVERNRGTIVAPAGARVRLAVARWFPGLVERLSKQAYEEMLATRPADAAER